MGEGKKNANTKLTLEWRNFSFLDFSVGEEERKEKQRKKENGVIA